MYNQSHRYKSPKTITKTYTSNLKITNVSTEFKKSTKIVFRFNDRSVNILEYVVIMMI